MFDFEAALASLDIDFVGDGRGGTADYNDKNYGTLDFLWRCNKTHVFINWFDVSPICLCGRGFMDVDCDCEWIAFIERDSLQKKFTKKQYLQIKNEQKA